MAFPADVPIETEKLRTATIATTRTTPIAARAMVSAPVPPLVLGRRSGGADGGGGLAGGAAGGGAASGTSEAVGVVPGIS